LRRAWGGERLRKRFLFSGGGVALRVGTQQERHRAALSDPDAPPATKAQLARARRVPTVRALRKKLNLTQEEFAARFHLPLGTVRDWEQGAHRPDKAAQVLLTVIAKDPDAVARALEG
jgi:putative transcriptional regulator